MKTIHLAFASTLLLSTSALAESKWGLGIGGIMENEGYIGVSTEVNTLPVIYYESENFYLLGPQFGYEFLSLGDLEFTFVGQYRFDGYEESDAAIFNGMDERAGSLDLGIEMEYETDIGDFSFEYLTDATSEHKGSEMSLTYALPIVLSNGIVTPYASLTNYSDDLVDYYYGVRVDEVTATRPSYEGKSTNSYELGVQTDWMFGDHHKVVSNIAYSQEGSEIKDSPLVDSSNSFQIIFGYVYEF